MPTRHNVMDGHWPAILDESYLKWHQIHLVTDQRMFPKKAAMGFSELPGKWVIKADQHSEGTDIWVWSENPRDLLVILTRGYVDADGTRLTVEPIEEPEPLTEPMPPMPRTKLRRDPYSWARGRRR